MNQFAWIRRRAVRAAGPGAGRARPSVFKRSALRPCLELLEDRCVPATFTVNSVADTLAPPAPTVTLRSALTAANAAAGADTINFAPSLTGQKILLTANLPAITDPVTITGPGQNFLTIDGAGAFQIFTINANAAATITDLTLRRGLSGAAGTNGGAINSSSSNLIVQRVTFSQNTASVFGGGLFNTAAGTAAVSDCTFVNNQSLGAGAAGGAIANQGSLVVNTSTVANNNSIVGGGLENFGAGTMAVNRSVVYGNFAVGGAGGGVRNNSASAVAVTLTNTTIAFNTSTGDTGGGAISNGIGTVTVLNCTIVGNSDTSTSASGSGGISIVGGTVNFTNSILSQNHGAAAATNDVNVGANVFNATTSLIVTGQVVGALQNNGGPTLSMAPLPDLPAALNAIDAGTNGPASTLTTDQRGFARLVGIKVDIGAVEFQPPAVSVAITVTPNTPSLPFHRAVTINVTVTPAATSPTPNNAPVTGTVTFLVNGTTVLGTATLDASGKAAFTTTSAVPLPLGSDTITARYEGDANYNPTVSNAVTEQVLRPTTTPGVFDPATATWFLRNSFSGGAPDITPFQFGAPGDLPIMGDWDGNGTFTVGVFTPATATFHLRNSNSAGPADFTFQFGPTGIGVPVAGDWDGDGVWSVGVFAPSRGDWNLRNELSGGLPDAGSFLFGSLGSKPVAGDWNGDGVFSQGVIEPDGTWKLKNVKATGDPDFSFAYGAFADNHIAGDWNGDDVWSPGVTEVQGGAAVWKLRNSNSSGPPDLASFAFGGPNALPVVGDFNFPALPQFAVGGEGRGAAAISTGDLNAIVQAALGRLQQAGVAPNVLNRLSGVTALIQPLTPGQLGQALPAQNEIVLSPDGAGHGWFVDPTPYQDEEFSGGAARAGSAAAGHEDLLTTVLHEMGHIAGLADDSGSALMAGALFTGTRHVEALSAVFGSPAPVTAQAAPGS